jgi:SAM-dependent methyltransferase
LDARLREQYLVPVGANPRQEKETMRTNEAAQCSQQQFAAAAAAYVTSAYHANGPDLPRLVEAGEFTGRESVVDFGSGAGHAALAVAPHVGQVVGIDVTPEMVAVASDLAASRRISNARFQRADVTELPFPDGSFDAVTSRQSAHHYGDVSKAIVEAYRVLQPGGRILIVDTVAPEDPGLDTFLNCFELLRDPSHIRDWRPSELFRMLMAAGFCSGEVVAHYDIALDGRTWVERMRTPAQRVEMIRTLFREASDAQRSAFGLRPDEPWALSVPVALLRARKPA